MHVRLIKIANDYKAVALMTFNTALLFVLLNLVLLIVIIVRDSGTNPLYELYPNVSWEEVYPHLDREDIDTLLIESSSIPLIYAPYIQYREARFEGRYFAVMEEGYRRSSGQKPWPPHPDRFNVFVFGGSTAFGYGVADDETILA